MSELSDLSKDELVALIEDMRKGDAEEKVTEILQCIVTQGEKDLVELVHTCCCRSHHESGQCSWYKESWVGADHRKWTTVAKAMTGIVSSSDSLKKFLTFYVSCNLTQLEALVDILRKVNCVQILIGVEPTVVPEKCPNCGAGLPQDGRGDCPVCHRAYWD